ncbi:hypothetical protein BHM03_00011075 [Ensete ventricosum]|nr:hypothetical protein BHM03_00011075 [Ensete ventricosum]
MYHPVPILYWTGIYFPYRVVRGKARSARYVSTRQLTSIRTGRYRAVLLKSTVGGQLREKSIVGTIAARHSPLSLLFAAVIRCSPLSSLLAATAAAVAARCCRCRSSPLSLLAAIAPRRYRSSPLSLLAAIAPRRYRSSPLSLSLLSVNIFLEVYHLAYLLLIVYC